MPLTAIAEAAMIAAIIPFVALLTGQSGVGPSLPFLTDALQLLQQMLSAPPLIAAATLFGLTVMVTAILRLALARRGQQVAFSIGHELAVEVYHRLLHQPYSFHLRRHSSEMLATLDKIDHLIFNLLLQLVQSASAVIIGLFVIGLLFAIDPLAATLGLVMIGGLFTVALLGSRKGFARHAPVLGRSQEQRLRAMQEGMGAIRDVILDQSQDAQLGRFKNIDQRFQQARIRTAFLTAAPRIIVEAAGLLLVAAMAILVAGRPGNIEAALPVLGALALGAYRLLPLMNQTYSAWAHIAASRPIMADVAKMLSLPMPIDCEPAIPLGLSSEIRIDQVSFLYPDRVHHALHGVSFTIAAGSRIAITGHTGSGKSTLADLLMGLVKPTTGRIFVDGVELVAPLRPAWRKSIAHVPQSIFLADASIAANIALTFDGSEPDQVGVRRAARIAQLDSFIETLPEGYTTRIGENGVLLSGGQRQRLALARALYKQAPVLVLDEATSALDDETEEAVIAALDEVQSEGCTIVIVTHRASTVARCNSVLVLEKGELVRSDSYPKPVLQVAHS